MAEYISKTKVRNALYDADVITVRGLQIINDFPAADVVPVVRCKDCKYYKTKHCTIDIWHDIVTIYKAKPDDYCSYGKRKED